MSEDEEGPVMVAREVLDGLEAVRRSGLVNILGRHDVAAIAEGMGFDTAAQWVRENRALYARGIFQGFVTQYDQS